MALTTPAVLLAEASERLGVRATLALRDARIAAAADANLDELLARAGRYGVRGLRRLAHDLQADWSSGDRAREGQPDADENAIEIVTVHHAKGREWPVVIPINAMGTSRRRDPMLHSPADNLLYWKLGDIQSPELAAALAADDAANARERTRLLYVACTRAEDLLIVPHVATAGADAYSRAADLGFDRLPELPLDRLQGRAPPAKAPVDGAQDAATFAAEQAALQAAATPIRWRTPSAHDADRLESTEELSEGFYDLEDVVEPVAGGRIRGLILHKLMEEVLAEDLPDTLEALQARAGRLNDELASEADAQTLDAEELARTVLRTLALPEVAELRDRLVPEPPVYGMLATDAGADPVGGRADAIAFADGAPEVVVDWKSDQAPTDVQTDAHMDQLRLYLAVTGARRGLIVYMSLGFVRHVQPRAELAL
jgi:ATP-dependent exoDNAse (exonuclease V) beta subunit